MGESESRRAWIIAAALVALVPVGCASGGGGRTKTARLGEALPSQTTTPLPAPIVNENPRPPATPPTSTAGLAGAPLGDTRPIDLTDSGGPEPGDETLIYIDPVPVNPTVAPNSLAAAAAQEKARRRAEAAPVLVLNNTNLASYAKGGVLTIANPESPAVEQEADDAEAALANSATQEKYWRRRGVEIRQRWADAVKRIPELVDQVEGLRNRFYSEDDPAFRDGQIKPQWDKALAELEEARYQSSRGQEEVLSYLEEGRRAGALPGWLREGSELEPEPVEEEGEAVDPSEPVEPVILEDSSIFDSPPISI